MQKSVLKLILNAQKKGEKLLAILIDPDKIGVDDIADTLKKIEPYANFLLVGGSTMMPGAVQEFVRVLEQFTKLHIAIFPGDYSQISSEADALLFLSLLSGRNPEYLIEQQVKAIPYIEHQQLEVIPTGYILIDGGKETAVQRVSKTLPIKQHHVDLIVNTAKAGEYMGNQLIYLEAGSGAISCVAPEVIRKVREKITIPLIVGGGIRSKSQIDKAYQSGADVVVIGTAFEVNNNFFEQIK